MARGVKRVERPVPAPLPPAERTVGQLVAESIKLYGRHFMQALPLGVLVAVANQLALDQTVLYQAVVFVVAAPLFTLAYGWASCLAYGKRPSRKRWLVALAAGTLVFIPAAALLPWFKVAVALWLGLIGLVVPVALMEQTSFGETFRRAIVLGRVDYVHAAGSLAAVVVLFGIAQAGLALLLESQADNTVRTAIFLSDAVLAPLLFLGGAVLYEDQRARLDRRAARRMR